MSAEGYVIVCQGLAGGSFTSAGKPPPKGQFLESYDPEAHQGYGWATWTTDRAQAMVFTDAMAAWNCWTQVPSRRPTRPDGQPNKPLTAFSIIVEPVGGEG